MRHLLSPKGMKGFQNGFCKRPKAFSDFGTRCTHEAPVHSGENFRLLIEWESPQHWKKSQEQVLCCACTGFINTFQRNFRPHEVLTDFLYFTLALDTDPLIYFTVSRSSEFSLLTQSKGPRAPHAVFFVLLASHSQLQVWGVCVWCMGGGGAWRNERRAVNQCLTGCV